MAKKSSGQRNFFRFMTLIGVAVIGGLLYAFIGSAPDLTDTEFHAKGVTPAECMACHVRNIDKNPIMPHRPMDSCDFCHKKPE